MEELKKLRTLLKKEQEEDLRQYQRYVVQTPLGERKKKGISWYPVNVVRAEIGTGEKYYVTIERTSFQGESHAFQTGSVVSIFQNTGTGKKPPSVSGVVSYVWRDTMKVALNDEELPDWLEYGLIGVDVLFDKGSYREMESALGKVIDAKEGRLSELREVLLGKKKAAFEENLHDFLSLPHLNSSQNKAIAKILAARDVATVHGPPGTGKTTTLVEAIALTLETEAQVLVTAPSNTAVDLLTERLLEKGLEVLRIGNPARVSDELMQHSLEAKIAQHPDYQYLKKLRKQEEEYRNMAGKYKRRFGKSEREQRRLLKEEARKVAAEAEYLEKYIIDQLLRDAQVVTATLVGSVNRFIRYKQFSTVFVDEAAQALEPATWIPIIKSQRVIFAGDHFQLPPTVKSYEAAQAGLSETLFEKCIQRQSQVDVMLNVQYRMHERIMQFSNAEFYKNELQAAEKVKNHLLCQDPLDAILGPPVEFVDTAGCSFTEKKHAETLSRFNPEEARLLLTHLTKLLEHLTAIGQLSEASFTAGIISPYRAQVAFLKENLLANETLKPYLPYCQVNTVDGFQGQEKELIYISLVRSNEKGKIGFLEDTRRMNVALTRARKKLVVIGDSATLSQHPFYQHFLDYIDKIGAYRSAYEWL